MSVPQLTTIDQASSQTKPLHAKRHAQKNRMYKRVIEFANQPSAPTLQQVQETAVGCLADYIVAWIETHGGHVDFSAATEFAQGVNHD